MSSGLVMGRLYHAQRARETPSAGLPQGAWRVPSVAHHFHESAVDRLVAEMLVQKEVEREQGDEAGAVDRIARPGSTAEFAMAGGRLAEAAAVLVHLFQHPLGLGDDLTRRIARDRAFVDRSQSLALEAAA